MNKIRIFILAADAPHGPNEFLRDFMRKTPDGIAGLTVVKPLTSTIKGNLIKSLIGWNPWGWKETVRSGMDAVFTQLKTPPLKNIVQSLGIPLFPTEKINAERYIRQLESLRLDLIISCGSVQIFGRGILDLPRLGCLNCHPSLLPDLRGPSPIFYALYRNVKKSGMTIHQMTPQIDEGLIYARREVTILPEDSLVSLARRIYGGAAETLLEAVERIKKSTKPLPPLEFPGSYNSFPSPNEWRTFFKNGHRLI